MDAVFNYRSTRARKARFASAFSRLFIFILSVLAVADIALGVYLWHLHPLVAGFIVSVGVWAFLPVLWHRYELKFMEPSLKQVNPLTVEDALDWEVVGRLSSIDSPFTVWQAVAGSWQQRFFCLRFGINASVYNTYLDTQQPNPQLWQDAVALSQKHGENRLSVAVVMVALLKTIANHKQILADAGITIEELETSIDWLHHIELVQKRLGSKVHFGGVARDWTAGFTPLINKLAHNMSVDIEHGGYIHRDLSVHSAVVDEMLKTLGSTSRANVALVGEAGVGKTTTVYAFAQRLLSDSHVPGLIKYHQVYMLSAAHLIARTSSESKLEAIVIGLLNEAVLSKNTILFLDDADMFFGEQTGAVDLARILLPVIEGGSLPVIFSFTPSQWQRFSASNPALASSINQLNMKAPDQAATMQVLEDQTLLLEARHNVMYTFLALKEAYKLAERYEQDLTFPGSAIKVLESAAAHAVGGIVDQQSVQRSVESTKGVKLSVAGTVESEQLLNLENEIHQRMVNQNNAVKAVSNALRRARSGINSPERPLGTFLFLGPTGVGKTELAKAVHDVYFANDEPIVRVDMNEFTQSADADRLIDAKPKDGLVASIKRAPFSVVLFDEIEKAASEVVTVFLQLLDEGVLRDSANKPVSFKDAIVIATSNAGSDEIRKRISAGQDLDGLADEFSNMLIETNQFKAEFINRFDEVVLFRPLNSDELLQVTDLLLAEINESLKDKQIVIDISQNAKRWLVEKGSDPKLGARPLRRIMQRTVENIVAKRLLSGSLMPGGILKLSLRDLEAEANQ